MAVRVASTWVSGALVDIVASVGVSHVETTVTGTSVGSSGVVAGGVTATWASVTLVHIVASVSEHVVTRATGASVGTVGVVTGGVATAGVSGALVHVIAPPVSAVPVEAWTT